MVTSIIQLDFNKTYSYTDYMSWQVNEYLELLKGKIFRMAAPSRRHQEVSLNLAFLIKRFLQGKSCKIYVAPFDVRLPRFDKQQNKEIWTVVQPDICMICDLTKLDDAGCIGAPDWVVEVLSPSNTQKEMKYKYEIYEEAGIKEYWIISLNDKVLHRYRLNDEGKYSGLRPLTSEDIATTPLLEGLEIDLSQVFSED